MNRDETSRRPVVLYVIPGGAALLLTLGITLFFIARHGTNQVALSSSPKLVTVEESQAATFRPSRTYVGTLEPWVEAHIGPQLISAYVQTVLVRPGAQVKRGEVLATLDCRNASAASKAVGMQAQAIEKTQEALAKQAARVSSMLDGGFVSPNEVDQTTAESTSKQAQLLALQAQMMGSNLQVADCVLRSPFDGEVADRSMDPGAFVRPGGTILSIVDRGMVRVTAEVPEDDYELVAPGIRVKMHLIATDAILEGTVARRSPSASASTRTVHIEVDVPNPDREIPVGTTAELSLAVGAPIATVQIPLAAATVRGSKASVFVEEEGVVRSVTVPTLGEVAGLLYVDPSLKPGTHVVTEGRAALQDGDHVIAQMERRPAEPSAERIDAGVEGSTSAARPRLNGVAQ